MNIRAPIVTLTTRPARSSEYNIDLSRATTYQIELALKYMKSRTGRNKTRILVCERELKRRCIDTT